jgi:hypothetical protein
LGAPRRVNEPTYRGARSRPLVAASLALVVVALSAGAAGAATYRSSARHPATTPSPSPSTSLAASSVTLVESPGPTGTTTDEYTLTANLSPSQAYGDVELLDNGQKIASATSYTVRWSYEAPSMTPGDHKLTLIFTPSASSGYAASEATIDYDVSLPKTVSPTPSPSAVKKTKDPQPISVIVSSAPATRTILPTTSPTVSTSVLATASARATSSSAGATSSGGGHMPFTGFDARTDVVAAAFLVVLGALLVLLGRVRRRPRGDHVI